MAETRSSGSERFSSKKGRRLSLLEFLDEPGSEESVVTTSEKKPFSDAAVSIINRNSA